MVLIIRAMVLHSRQPLFRMTVKSERERKVGLQQKQSQATFGTDRGFAFTAG